MPGQPRSCRVRPAPASQEFPPRSGGYIRRSKPPPGECRRMPFAGPDKRQKVLVLLTMCFALFMAMLDNTVVNVALPTISRKLGAGVSGLQWVVDGYVLAFASLLLTGGILGDRYGRKKVFILGLFGF